MLLCRMILRQHIALFMEKNFLRKWDGLSVYYRKSFICSGKGLGKDGDGIKKSIVVKKRENDEGVSIVGGFHVDWL